MHDDAPLLLPKTDGLAPAFQRAEDGDADDDHKDVSVSHQRLRQRISIAALLLSLNLTPLLHGVKRLMRLAPTLLILFPFLLMTFALTALFAHGAVVSSDPVHAAKGFRCCADAALTLLELDHMLMLPLGTQVVTLPLSKSLLAIIAATSECSHHPCCCCRADCCCRRRCRACPPMHWLPLLLMPSIILAFASVAIVALI